MTWGEKIAIGFSAFWIIGVFGFMFNDLIDGIRSKKMTGVVGGNYAPGGIYPIGNGGITLSTNAKTSFSGKVYMDNGAVVENMDVGEGLRLISFFLQSRHPEVFEEYNAIRKIEKS